MENNERAFEPINSSRLNFRALGSSAIERVMAAQSELYPKDRVETGAGYDRSRRETSRMIGTSFLQARLIKKY